MKRLPMLGLPALLLIAFVSVRVSPDIESGRAGVDVEHYRFHITVSDTSDVITGKADVTVLFTDSIKTFFLDLVGKSLDGRGMEVSQVLTGGTPVAFEHAGNRLTMKTDATMPGEKRTFSIYYSGHPADGLIISANKFGGRTFFGDNWPNRARHWLPTVDHVSDKAFVDWIITMPDHYDAVANGRLVEQSSGLHGAATRHWKTIAPIPPKVMVVGIAEFAIQHRGTVEGIPVQSWVYPEDRQSGFTDFSVADSMLQYFVRQIGEFPYAKLANVESTTRYGGMENASAIFYAEQGVTGRRANEATVAHEIAHQWFGDSVTEGDWHHIWLSEGFATYFANLYWEYAYGREDMNVRLKAQRDAVVIYSRAAPNSPVVDKTITDPNDLLTANSYQKGGWVLHMLRNEIGDEAFWNGIRLYYARFRDANAVTDDLQAVMEEASGKDLQVFFDQWIYRAGQPQLGLSWSAEAAKDNTVVTAVTIEQMQSQVFEFPLEIGITLASGEMLVEVVQINQATQTFAIEVDGPVEMVRLDPNTNLLFSTP